MKLDFPGQHSDSLQIADWGLRNADLKARSQETEVRRKRTEKIFFTYWMLAADYLINWI